MLPGFGFTGNQQQRMGNCVSSQSQAGALEKQAAGSRGRGLVAMRKAAMEKYPVPNKCRVTPSHEETPTTTAGQGEAVVQMRSRLRPPSVNASNFTGRPLSVQLGNSKTFGSNNGNGPDSNGNIPRPSSLPRLLKATEPNVAAKIESLLTGGKPNRTSNVANRPDLTKLLMNSNRTIINPPPVKSTNNSPSPSARSVASSLDSNRSASVADSGIATSSSRSPSTGSEPANNKCSALPVANKFGFVSSVKKSSSSSVERMNYVNSAASASSQQNKTTPRPSPLRIPSAPVKATARFSQQHHTTPTSTDRVRQVSPQLAQIRSRAAQVLSNRRQQPTTSTTLGPRLSVEAIVASLENEMRQQLGPEPPPLTIVKEETPENSPGGHSTSATSAVLAVDVVERFLAEPANAAEITFLSSGSGSGGDEEEEEEDFIDDIELQLQTPSTSLSVSGSQNCSPRERSHDEGHQTCDEEDSAATSISDDAMIDDEIADQPGLVMLGQSASVPASPLRAWRSESFQYHLAGSPDGSVFPPYHPHQSEEDPISESTSATSYRRSSSVRRVASVSDIDWSLRCGGSSSAAMRAELYGGTGKGSGGFNGWPSISKSLVPIELEDYAAMASELADIKAQLVTLQTVLLEADGPLPDIGTNSAAAPLWDLKRDLVLLREELQEKNTTIRSLRNELKAVGSCLGTNRGTKSSAQQQQLPSCNVATQTDRARTTLSNGVSPTENGSEDGQLLVSTSKLKLPSVRTISTQQEKQTPVRLPAAVPSRNNK